MNLNFINTALLSAENKEQVDIGFLKRMLDSIVHFLPTIAFAVVVLIVGVLLSKLCLKMMSKGLAKSKIDKTAHSFLKSLVRVVLYTVVLVIVLSILKVPTSSIVAIIGASGLAIGLALQSSISNLAGGFIILFSKPFKVGDYIMAGSVEGNVQAISILYTRLLTLDNKAIYIPNGQVSNMTLINFTDEEIRRLDVRYSIAYENDFRQAEKIISDIVSKNNKSILTPEPIIRLAEHGASSLDIDCKVWVKAKDYWNLKYDLNEDVKTAFDENGISIPYNQLDVMIKK